MGRKRIDEKKKSVNSGISIPLWLKEEYVSLEKETGEKLSQVATRLLEKELKRIKRKISKK